MDVVDLVSRVRDHFVEQFGAFVDQQREATKFGSPEVKMQLGETSEVFERLYCVDFVRPSADSGPDSDVGVDSDIQEDDEADEEADQGIVEFQPGFYMEFEPTDGVFGTMAVAIEHLRWHDVVFYHDIKQPSDDHIAEWFEIWFDPDDERYDPDARYAEVIHSLVVKDGMVSVDFGTAPAVAFWDMLELLEGAGVKKLRVTCSPGDEQG